LASEFADGFGFASGLEAINKPSGSHLLRYNSREVFMPRVIVKPNKDGKLEVPAEMLGGTSQEESYSVELEGYLLNIEPTSRPRKIHEIEDPEERAKAVETLLDNISHKTGTALPEWHVIRDSIYD
jgi:hypothetical protein